MKRLSGQRIISEQLIEGLLDLSESETDLEKREKILDLIKLAYTVHKEVYENKESLASKLFKKFLEKVAESGIEELVEIISESIGENF
ncbi:MAG: hypothetical protein KDD02_25365 [Phaeodactylibacter sp.]|nr:hypothetical protein [Phaeodactylibacter sp.]